MMRKLQTVAAFAAAGPFTESQLRWWIFVAAQNGLAQSDAICRLGRRVYIDSDRFESWIDSQNNRERVAT